MGGEKIVVANSLKRALKARHLSMMCLGAVVGAGYLLGAGAAIKAAGPAVIVSYALGGLITLLVVALLAEMAAAMPVAGSFQFYVTLSLGGWAGFVTGWTYWLAFLLGPATETIVAGSILHSWFPAVPAWAFYILIAALAVVVNVVGVLFFGEAEFWLSMIKAAALVAFILVGAFALFSPSAGVSMGYSFSDLGGFAPTGLEGILGAMMIVIFAYGGAESIGMASEESKRPKKDIPKSMIGMVLTIIVLYMLSTAILVGVLPWTEAGLSSSPYADAFNLLLGQRAALAMNFVVLTAALSTIGMGVYATSRVLFSMSRDGYFPRIFSHTGRGDTPSYAIAASGFVLLLGAMVFYLFPDFAYIWLASLSGFGFLFSWLMIALSHPGQRELAIRKGNGRAVWKVPFYPYVQYLTVMLMALVIMAQIFLPGGVNVLSAGAVWLILASIYYHIIVKRDRLKL